MATVRNPPEPVVHRNKLLTNPPAEYLETGLAFRAWQEYIAAPETSVVEVSDGSEDMGNPHVLSPSEDSPEFVPELDRFMPKDTVAQIHKCYRLAAQTRSDFQQRLEGLVAILKARDVDKELKIELRDPGDFTMEYLLEILEKITQAKQKKRVYSVFFRKCFRKLEDNREIAKGLLGMIPDDIYGSLISGGFTLILVCLEKHAEQREATEKFLRQIQDDLEGIQRLTKAYYSSLQVHTRADAILASVFTVLERIIDKITESWSDKLPPLKGAKRGMRAAFSRNSKGKDTVSTTVEPTDRAKSVVEAIEQLKCRINEFQSEINIAEAEMLANIDGKINVLTQHAMKSSKAIQEMKEMKETNELDRKFVQTFMTNIFYNLLKSDSFIDNRTAQINHEQMRQAQIEQGTLNDRFRRQNTQRIASAWLTSLGTFVYDARVDVEDCLGGLARLDYDECSMAQNMLDSDELRAWLQSPESAFLVADVGMSPRDLHNPLSFGSALLVQTLRHADAAFAVLAFFCRHRNLESPDAAVSGPLALVKSLIGQLLDFIRQRRPTVDLSLLESQVFFAKSTKRLGRALEFLSALLGQMPDGDTVFVLLDSLSGLSGSEEEGHALLRELRRMVRLQRHVCVRVLVTDPLVPSPLEKFAQWKLHIGDVGGVFDLDDTRERIEELSREESEEDEEEDEEDEEDEDDEDDEDED